MDAGTKQGLELVKFSIHPDASRFTVQAFATGMLSSLGHNPTLGIRSFDGEIECEPATYEKAAVRMTVRTDAMEVLDEMKREDRDKMEQEMYEKILETSRFPAASFESKEIAIEKLGADLFRADVKGELTFHGQTRPESFSARVTAMGPILRISGEFPLRQSDYGIRPFSFAGGALRLKDDLKFRFELLARKQE